jgi:hypothetical protein
LTYQQQQKKPTENQTRTGMPNRWLGPTLTTNKASPILGRGHYLME